MSRSHPPVDRALEPRVTAERVDAVFAQLPVALLAVAVNSSLLAYVVSSTAGVGRILVWLAAMWVVILGRIALLYAYRRRTEAASARTWGNRFCAGAAANGVAWGAGALMFFPSGDVVVQMFIAFVLGGMTAGATASSSSLFPAFAAFALPALTPMVLRLFDEGQREHVLMAVMLILFGLAMAQIARTTGHRLIDSHRLRFSNESLTERLTELNRELEARVAERTAELLTANRVKDEFLAVVSHELRTPLSAVLGWAEMLKLPELPESKHRHAVENIERNALAQAKLLEDLLDLSRVTSGNPNVELVPLEPAAVVTTAVEAIRPVLDAKRVRFEARIDQRAATICGDEARIQQILRNLLGNAAKFTPEGGLVVLDMHEADDWLEIEVRDTGQGMDPEFIPFAFDRFTQARPKAARAQSGLGLGLAISRQLAQLHGGTLDAFSAGPGRGSTFTLRLPRVPARAAASAPPAKGASLAGISVLLVDDDPDTREVLGTMIEKAGAVALPAAGTDEALSLVRHHHPAVIVSDLDMPGPGGDGFALIRAIRYLPPDEGGRTPAVALSAHASTANQSQAFEAGFQGFLAKPIGSDQLVDWIASVTRSLRPAS